MQENAACIRLASGLVCDFTNLYGPGRVTAQDVADLAAQVQAAHRAVEHMRTAGEVRGHLSKDGAPEQVLFTRLPYVTDDGINTPASLARLKEFGLSQRRRTDAVVFLGIGGSYLGNKVLFDTYGGEFWNQRPAAARDGYPQVFFSGNNIDPRRTKELADHLLTAAQRAPGGEDARPYRVLLVVISKSGATLDTMSNFLVLYDTLRRAAPRLAVEVAAVTDPAVGEGETLLHRLARENGWALFGVPDGVGGRFSVFSEVGLVTAACIGFDIDGFLAGARDMDGACRSGDVWQNPALLNAVLKYLAAVRHGRTIEVFMPYGDELKSLAEWYVQLLAESLGKRRERGGRRTCYGRTPMVAVGTTDMHSQTQLHQDGPRDKVVQFVRVAAWRPDPVIPNVFPQVPQLAAMAGIPMSRALDAALAANAAALAADGRFNATFALPELSAYHLGSLMYMLALSVAYEGELADVDAFDQPGVEAYKRLLGPLLHKD